MKKKVVFKKLILSVLIILILFNFIYASGIKSNLSFADDDTVTNPYTDSEDRIS